MLAAAMSSLDSSINAISTVVVVDVLKSWLAKGRNDRFYLFAARCVGIGAAVLMIGGAILFSSIKKESMNDLSWIIASVFGGCLVGLFMVGFFTKRVDSFSAMVALVLSIVINVYLGLGVAKCLPESLTIPIHSYWGGRFGQFAFGVRAGTRSVFRPPPRPVVLLARRGRNKTLLVVRMALTVVIYTLQVLSIPLQVRRHTVQVISITMRVRRWTYRGSTMQ